MKHLVIGVSKESSLDLLGLFADVVRLDSNLSDFKPSFYDTTYIRSHFSEPSLTPEYFRTEITEIIESVISVNPNAIFIDGMDTVDAIMAFEDKWLQYLTFSSFMPRTEEYDERVDASSFTRPVFKRRLSSNGSGVTWSQEKAVRSNGEWIIQETLDVEDELRVYVLNGSVYPIGTVRESMTEEHKVHGIDSRTLTSDELDFSSRVASLVPDINFIGLDIARSPQGKLSVIEVNRSPGFAKFEELTGFNLASVLYDNLNSNDNS